jgi:hypothetical protein
MPFRSKKQNAWAHTDAGTEALGGPAKVKEWESDTNYSSLPEKVASGAADENSAPKQKKFNYAPKKARAGYTQSQRAA